MKLDISRILSYIIGLLILSLGITITIKSDMGAGAWDALNVGLSKLFFTVGTWVIIVGIILIFVNAFLLKSKPDFYSLITVFIVGLGIDTWLLLFAWLNPETLPLKLLVFLIGLVLLAFGISVYLQAKFAPVPIDNLMIAIHTRFGVNMSIAKTIGELLALLFAFLFNGPIGIGTILVTFLVGPIIHFFHPKMERLVARYQ